MTSIIITDKQLGQFIAAAYTGGLIAGDALCKETFSKATEVVAKYVKPNTMAGVIVEAFRKLIVNDPQDLVNCLVDKNLSFFREAQIPVEELKKFSREVAPGIFEFDPAADFMKAYLETLKTKF